MAADPFLRDLVALALREDVGPGDVTSRAAVPAESKGAADFTAREAGVIAGWEAVAEVLRQVDMELRLQIRCCDGSAVEPGELLAHLSGPSRSILTAERTALNFLQHLSGIATATARMAGLLEGLSARLVDTRKTVPGMRSLAKAAVRAGGGRNHRFGLYDGILIKDNHVASAGSITAAIHCARQNAHHLLRLEVECDDLDQVREALEAGADLILLDNMEPELLERAVQLCRGRCLVEASGGVTEGSIRAIAETGVDFISSGALTHSVRALDIGLDWTAP